MLLVFGARVSRISLAGSIALGCFGLGACSYEFGGAPGGGGEGGAPAAGSGVYTSTVGTTTSGTNGSTGGPVTTATSTTTTDTVAASTTQDTTSTGIDLCGNGALDMDEECDGAAGTPTGIPCKSCKICGAGRYFPELNRCYYYGEDGVDELAARCAAWLPGATLARPKASAEHDALDGIMPGGKSAYFDLKRVGNDGTDFQWSDATVVEGFEAWEPNYPSDIVFLNCVVLQRVLNGPRWANVFCDSDAFGSRGYLCEYLPPQ